ncbi:HEAT repeat domain-containing protein [Aureibaculum sp. 2210JD6-5]|uniref:HEAT repeat domain-containing protein n=1 Tax=Aureibaculum sp. 2210JD6-5 TaxID=3103957 RepID=UPI002AAD6513|nr:HEAT repeat domain-containing protein [Aureibaculum sp. 2210JD6-5]MDY7395355.1 HEAT repeat domain-containing protein [Aureibaculum sp. 2210JD6-5]
MTYRLFFFGQFFSIFIQLFVLHMAFYDLLKDERSVLVNKINEQVIEDISNNGITQIINYASDEDTYIRKTTYQAIGKSYNANRNLRSTIINILKKLLKSDNEKIRQTTVNAAGEIGKFHFEEVQEFFDIGLFDQHHSVRNAVIGSIKKMGEINPKPVLSWAANYLEHPDKEIRREICHGIELRGRKYPQDILPLLAKLQFDKTARVRNTLIHVLGQIAYKKGCLATVISHLNTWKNKELIKEALDEIVDVHHRYKNFAVLTQQEAIDYIDKNYIIN